MSDLLDIKSAADRSAECKPPPPIDPEVQRAEYESHCLRAIKGWTSGDSGRHTDNDLVLSHLSMISKETLDSWTEALTSKGYKVVVSETTFTVSFKE